MGKALQRPLRETTLPLPSLMYCLLLESSFRRVLCTNRIQFSLQRRTDSGAERFCGNGEDNKVNINQLIMPEGAKN
jgi:hypothetical protein